MRISARGIIVYDNNLLVIHRDKFGDQYYTLPGGGLDINETIENCLRREVLEETSIQITDLKLVFIEDDKFYGRQNIFLAKYLSGQIALNPNSSEYKINQLGKNIYTPKWLAVSDLAKVNFKTPKLQQAILNLLANNLEFNEVTAL